jgi:glutathione peroxidase-family protein
LIDPQGRVVVAYGPEITPQAVMKDVRRLLKRNPAAPR